MIIRCRCGKTWTASPYKNNAVKTGWCDPCRQKRLARPKILLSFRPNLPKSRLGVRIRIKPTWRNGKTQGT
jgi:hypothetical protein